jgi:hypothetical protein
VRVIFEPGTRFKYSGAGFIVLQHIIEHHARTDIDTATRPFLTALGIAARDFTFDVNKKTNKASSSSSSSNDEPSYALGQKDDGSGIEGGFKMFPAFAAGALCTVPAMQAFLVHLGRAYQDPSGSGPISHATARRMLAPHDRDFAFMGCHIGVGIFVLVSAVGGNRYMLHQGANDGYRVICLHCFDGVDKGRGFTVACAGDQHGVLFNCEASREVVRLLGFAGVRVDQFRELPDLRTAGLKQEEIVNIGYRDLLLSAFEPVRGPVAA